MRDDMGTDLEESWSTHLNWVLEAAELLDSTELASYVMQEARSPVIQNEPFSDLERLVLQQDFAV